VRLDKKKIVLGVSGGIAAYKSCELVRELRRRGAEVRVMMSPAATRFVQPLTFAALTEAPVFVDMFNHSASASIEHIQWSRWGEVIVVCPATANTIARLAHGLAEEPVSATILAARVPVVLCPAMNTAMWEHPLVQHNLEALRQIGYRVVDPEMGPLATTAEGEGWGRLARNDWILSEILAALQKSHPLEGKRVLVTAGRTEEYLDPVRMITNPSSGRMGFAVAEMAAVLGGEVTLVHGPTDLAPPYKCRLIPVVSAGEMAKAVLDNYAGVDIVVMAAAVSDYRPVATAPEKIKKDGAPRNLKLEPTEDILLQLAGRKSHALHVGFAVETENLIAGARDKLRRKKLDLIVVNNPRQPGAGFKTETNQVAIVDAAGQVENLPLMSKSEVAVRILEKVIEQMP